MNERTAQEKINELLTLRAFLAQHICLIDDEVHVIQRASELVQQPTEIHLKLPEVGHLVPHDQPERDAESYEASPHQYAGQRRSHMDVARDAALTQDGVVHLTTVAKEIIGAGMSNVKKPSAITSNLHRQMSRSSDWEKVNAGTFRLLSYQDHPVAPEVPDDEADAAASASMDAADIRPVDGETRI